jgi:arylsulfatase A-like enzyme
MQKKHLNFLLSSLLKGNQFFLMALLCISTQAHAQSKKPNIVFLLIDDLGYADCGFNGGKDILTPNIDRLAKAGSILENHYVQPVCSPTRSALMTGRYPTKTGIYNVITPGAPWGLSLNERTLATALQEAGYSTAITGKWHLGEFEKAYQPNARGFDHQYGNFFGAIDYFTHIRNHQIDWYRNGTQLKEEGYSTHLIAREACQTIEKNDQKKPLFLYVPFNGVHSPFQVPEQYTKAYPNLVGNRQKLAGMLAALDEAVGQIMASLKKAGMLENTLIVFSSDNGGPPPGNNAPLRDYKATIYEGGTRAAAFAHWPGHIPAGKNISGAMHIIDWYPTLLRLAGGSLKQALPIDGKDVWPMITKGEPSPHKAILSVSNRGVSQAAIRMGDWKLIVADAEESDSTSQKKQPKKYVSISLYNLAEDPGESRNLASTHPERVADMRKELSVLLKDAVAPGGK